MPIGETMAIHQASVRAGAHGGPGLHFGRALGRRRVATPGTVKSRQMERPLVRAGRQMGALVRYLIN